MLVGSAVGTALMIMAVIGIAIAFYINRFIVCENNTTFPTSHDLDKIKGECTGLTDCAHGFSFVRSANALAGIFQ